MLNYSQNFKKNVTTLTRDGVIVKAVINNIEVFGDNIIDMKVTENFASSPNPKMGETCSSELVLNMYMPETAIALRNAEILAYFGMELDDSSIEWIPLGVFYVTDVFTDSNFAKVRVTAMDGMSKLEDEYKPSITEFPADIQDIVNDICSQHSVEIENIPWESYFVEWAVFEEQYSCREMLGFIAGLLGCNARFNREGKLEMKWFTQEPYVIDRSQIYQSSFGQKTVETITFSAILSGTEDNPIDSGTGRPIIFSNPFMTQTIADNIMSSFVEMTYKPSSVVFRGNPALEAGDHITVEDDEGIEQEVMIMRQTTHLSGGLRTEIECYGTGETEQRLIKKPTEAKLRRMYAGLSAAIASATEKIAGAQGGYFKLEFDAQGFPSGWVIMDTPELSPTTKLWRFNHAGLAWSSNGGASYSNIAITMDGEIVANAITAGTMSAERIAVENYGDVDEHTLDNYIRFENGNIVLGKTNNELVLKIENDKISFISGLDTPAEKTVAYFSNNSLEIVDVERVRFGNFGFVPRESGNLTFTKVV